MNISTNNALTAVSYGAVGCVSAMAAANAVLVGAGASAKAGAYVADYFKNESVAQNLRIKGDQLISLAGKYAATELKVAAALVAVGGSAALAQYAMDKEIPCDKNDEVCNTVKLYEMKGMCFDKALNLTKYAEDVAARDAAAAAKAKEDAAAAAKAQQEAAAKAKAKEDAAAAAKAKANVPPAADPVANTPALTADDVTLDALAVGVAKVGGKVVLEAVGIGLAIKVVTVTAEVFAGVCRLQRILRNTLFR